MADYYAILKKAISALPKNTGEARRAIYEKARRALVTQLQNYDPPLSPSEITAQRLTLEEAVRKVEAEAARESLGLSPLARAPRVERQPVSRPTPPVAETPPPAEPVDEAGPEPQPQAEKAPEPVVSQKPSEQNETSDEKALADRAETGDDRKPVSGDEELTETGKSETGRSGFGKSGAGKSGAGKSETEEPAEKKSDGREAFREVVAEAAKLGAASAEATRSARRALYREDAEDDGDAAPERVEPLVGRQPKPAAKDRSADTDEAVSVSKAEKGWKKKDRKAKDRKSRDQASPKEPSFDSPDSSVFDHDMAAEPMSMRGMWLIAVGVVVLVLVAVGAWIYAQRDSFLPSGPGTTLEQSAQTPASDTAAGESSLAPKISDRLPGMGESGPASDARAVQTMRVTAPTAEETVNGDAVPADSGAMDGDGADQPTAEDSSGDQSSGDEGAADESVSAPQADAGTAPQAAPQTSSQTSTQTAQRGNDTVAVGQRAILYEEGQSAGAAGQAYTGQVVWRLATEPANKGGGTDTVLIATADIPSRDMQIELKFRPNRDGAMPASHWIEISFTVPDNFVGKGIGNVPGLILKTTEEARGDALRGASARVLDNLFWIALSKDPEERRRNRELLEERGWIDIPILYESGKRAILTLEKGAPGDRLVKEAFKAWGDDAAN